eukprot:2659473-Pleurochrysis_carterae.AAC.2
MDAAMERRRRRPGRTGHRVCPGASVCWDEVGRLGPAGGRVRSERLRHGHPGGNGERDESGSGDFGKPCVHRVIWPHLAHDEALSALIAEERPLAAEVAAQVVLLGLVLGAEGLRRAQASQSVCADAAGSHAPLRERVAHERAKYAPHHHPRRGHPLAHASRRVRGRVHVRVP